MKLVYVTVGLLVLHFSAVAQEAVSRTCGIESVKQRIIQQQPAAEAQFKQTLEENIAFAKQMGTASANKTTAANHAIPVVFHIMLSQIQQTALGGAAGIQKRVDSQMAVINRDFNAENGDNVLIPAGFKSVYGDAGIRFALAHRAPDGSASPGYEVVTTKVNGFEESSAVGSGMSFAEGKFLDGNPTAWDPEKYLNIWVFNLLDGGKQSSILGVTMPPSFLSYGVPGLTKDEMGIVLNYAAFGAQGPGVSYFLSNINGGRTLTHELGHYFEVWHVWGDDNGRCLGSGGQDDGISDTPPQAAASNGCPAYPLFDACTATGDGVMFMNFMDYVNDACMHMFTKEQAKVMNSMIVSGKESYSLTQNPELTQWPLSVSNSINAANVFAMYPNPATGNVTLILNSTANNIQVHDMTGRLIEHIAVNAGTATYHIDMRGKAKGVYIVKCGTDKGDAINKLIVQ